MVENSSFDYKLLIARIKSMYECQDDFAKELGIGRVSLSLRLNNKAQFRQCEIKRGAILLKISNAEIPKYFFCASCSETRTNKANNKEEE